MRCGWMLGVAVLGAACGHHQGPGEVTRHAVPASEVTVRAATERETAARLNAPADKQILFGDLHVHTTYSADAFTQSLPVMQGEGAHPPADACDFARFCSALDFWSINDHAETVSPEHWLETKEAIRQCNAVAGDPRNPDLVAFLGWEWTQVGATPKEHYGHKNVMLRETAEDRVPARPIAAPSRRLMAVFLRRQPLWQQLQFPLLDFANHQAYLDFRTYQDELRAVDECPAGVDVHDLPPDCRETAATPAELFEKLGQWGFDALVIPHGNTWGFYTPPGSSWDKQLVGAEHDPGRQRLIEVYSGHGNSEEYREWKDIDADAGGDPVCPAPTRDYEPCCWRAGELVRERCGDVAEECERRAEEARLNYLRAGVSGRLTVPGSTAEDWKDCGQCRDCFNPSFNFRPRSSVQYAVAATNLDDPGEPRRFRFGFVASSDNHSARPGTGYKEFARRGGMTEAAGPRSEEWFRRIAGPDRPPRPESEPFDPAAADEIPPFRLVDFERQASFFMTGGLAAVHATGRDRDSIWQALERREVYGTSGERILLWFDLVNAPRGPAPMGSEVRLRGVPRFRARAAGSFRQKPGCPRHATTTLGPGRLERLCKGECYHPDDERHRITRIEIVRIRAQSKPGESIGSLIDDPWRKIGCPDDPSGCVVEVEDPDFAAEGREVAYYARAIQEPTPAVNAGGLRCRYDEKGECYAVEPCYGDYRTPYDDDCLGANEERAWSSPIYVEPGA